MAQEASVSKIQTAIANTLKKPAIIPFIVSGFPDMETTRKLIKVFENSGAAAVELGFPYSDPLADGPVIQKAAKHSLENGTNTEKIFELLEEIKYEIKIPIILFTYFNPVFKYGIEKFIKKAASVNASGLIIPDLPLEESEEVRVLCKENCIDFIMLVAPTSGEERINNIAQSSSGFIYLVSSTGVTGVREYFSDVLEELIKEIKKVSNTPVAVGFGISKPEHVKNLKNLGADGVIIGSAIIKLINESKENKQDLLDNITEYVRTLGIFDE